MRNMVNYLVSQKIVDGYEAARKIPGVVVVTYFLFLFRNMDRAQGVEQDLLTWDSIRSINRSVEAYDKGAFAKQAEAQGFDVVIGTFANAVRANILEVDTKFEGDIVKWFEVNGGFEILDQEA